MILEAVRNTAQAVASRVADALAAEELVLVLGEVPPIAKIPDEKVNSRQWS